MHPKIPVQRWLNIEPCNDWMSPRLGVGLKAIEVLRVTPCDLPFVTIRNIVSSLEHLHRVRPRSVPMRIIGRVKQLVGADALNYIRNRGFLQFEGVEKLVASHVLAWFLLQERRFP